MSPIFPWHKHRPERLFSNLRPAVSPRLAWAHDARPDPRSSEAWLTNRTLSETLGLPCERAKRGVRDSCAHWQAAQALRVFSSRFFQRPPRPRSNRQDRPRKPPTWSHRSRRIRPRWIRQASRAMLLVRRAWSEIHAPAGACRCARMGASKSLPGYCCWPGQDVGESTDRCLGVVAYCPAGTVPNPSDAEDCLRVCPGGKVEVASGHCCWPGQIWRKETGACAGRPKCPPEMVPDPRTPMECLRSCTGGRLEVAPGHCCWPGETWSEDAQKCAGAATCPAGTMTNPRNVSECLRPCPGDRVEVTPGHCCWPGQAWNIDIDDCEGPAVACTAHMRLSPTGECVPIAGPCQTSADCSDDSVCLAGRCEPGHRFRRLEVFLDGVPFLLGAWSRRPGGAFAAPPSPVGSSRRAERPGSRSALRGPSALAGRSADIWAISARRGKGRRRADELPGDGSRQW